MSRYESRPIEIMDVRSGDNKTQNFLLKRRGNKRTEFYSSPKFYEITEEMINESSYVVRLWKTGDRFYKLASEFYGDPTLWWIIAAFNKKPTEGHVSLGDQILIPNNIEQIYDSFAR